MNIKQIIREEVNNLLSEGVTRKEINEFITDFGYLISLNLAKVTQQAIDSDASNELNTMLKNIRKPIINNMNYFQITDHLWKNPSDKMLTAFIGKIREMIMYVEPRITKFVVDGKDKDVWLNKISDLKERYKKIIQ